MIEDLIQTTRQPLTDSTTGRPLAPMQQPGYYAGFSTLAQQAYWDEATRRVVRERMQNVPPIRFFKPDEAATMQAVVDRIIPQEDRIRDRRIPVLPMIDDRLFNNKLEGYRYEDMPPDQQAYRIAARAFDKMAQTLHGRAFHELETLQQEQIIRSVHHAQPLAADEIWKQMNIERFWTILVGDCVTAYYSHPWAWDEIGFGGPAYPRGYMRLEDGQPEPWEVDEKRYEWTAPSDTLSDTAEPFGSGDEHQAIATQGGTH